MRWPFGPPHLALEGPKPCLFFGVWFFFVSFLGLLEGKTVFPIEGHFCLLFSVSLCFSLDFFHNVPFALSLSPSLSLSLSCYFLSSLLLFLLFTFFCLLVFVSLFICLVSLLLFHEKSNIKTLHWKVSFLQSFLFWGASCLALSFKSLFLIFISFLI